MQFFFVFYDMPGTWNLVCITSVITSLDDLIDALM